MPHVGQEMSFYGTPDFTPFGEFMISPIHYYIHYIICQSKDYVYGLMTGLFAWISLNCFVIDLFNELLVSILEHIKGTTYIK